MKLSIKYKVLIAFFFFSVAPLSLLSYFSVSTIKNSGENLINEAVGSLEKEEEKRLIREAENHAKRVADFLNDRQLELYKLAGITPNEKDFLDFWKTERERIWYASYNNGRISEKRMSLPLYKEIAYIGEDGWEKILIKDGRAFKKEELRYVADKKNTTYSTEDYFQKTKGLPENEVYLSPIAGFAMTKYDQIGTAKLGEIKGGNRYNGVLRFSMPVYKNGGVSGVVTIAVDHVHLQGLSIHVEPKYGQNVVFSSYESGNYAFIFDASGWIITHPKYWNFPGVFKDGRPKKYMTIESKKDDIENGVVGFNLAHAGFISEGYPTAYRTVMEKKSGIVTVTNVGGVRKVMAYAPIIIRIGGKEIILGGFTLGAGLENFEASTKKSHKALTANLKNYRINVTVLFVITVFLVAAGAIIFSRHITEPILTLSKKARFFGDTDFDTWEKIKRDDEIGMLAEAFYSMNKKNLEQKDQLMLSMDEIKNAKALLEDYNFYLKRQIDSLKDEDLRQADRLSSIGRLAAGLAHEIRNPLTGITLFLDDLHDNMNSDPESQKLIAAALKEIERVERLVKGLLDFSSPKPPSKSLVDIEDIIDSVEILVKKQCAQRGIQLVREKPDKTLNIFADKEKIRQAVLNIVLNAVDILSAGGKIIISASHIKTDSSDYAVIEIKDTGPGIREEDIDKIFEPFFTLRDGGTGLGLAISKSIIGEHGGTIFAKNYENGAVFEIWLPHER